MPKAVEPKSIKAGATIGIVAPASAPNKTEIDKAVEILKSHGFKVQLGKYIYNTHRSFSACDEYRLADFQWAIDSNEIDAIICARGGYGSQRILEKIDLNHFKKKPKWIAGFSDITAIHNYILKTSNICTIHGPMLSTFIKDDKENEDVIDLINMLKGERAKFLINKHKLNREGEFSGQMIGGNLAVLTSMMATSYHPSIKNKILFIEDINEDLYKLDRMMQTLKLGNLDKLGALVCGHFTNCKAGSPEFAKNAYSVIHDAIKEYKFPVSYGFPSGHEQPNMPWIHGKKYNLRVGSEHTSLE
ncbi:MAG: LD-carboxypeptidase [Bacteroidales bacterium]